MFGGDKDNIGDNDMPNKHTIQMLEIRKSSETKWLIMQILYFYWFFPIQLAKKL